LETYKPLFSEFLRGQFLRIGSGIAGSLSLVAECYFWNDSLNVRKLLIPKIHDEGMLGMEQEKDGIATFYAPDQAAWRAWLEGNHDVHEKVWLVIYRKGSGIPSVYYPEAVDEALCFGWIDSKPNKLDDERSMLWFAPRKARTGWSKPNKLRVERMLRAGLMHPTGLAKIEQAKSDGSWTSLDAIEELELPTDLAAALAAYPRAEENFQAFPRSVKRGILEWIHTAKKPETRAKRIAETARLANVNERANQWRGNGAA
jgi:uncharacterized protein YdeI (YjbR/CyaY-like superfamily)